MKHMKTICILLVLVLCLTALLACEGNPNAGEDSQPNGTGAATVTGTVTGDGTPTGAAKTDEVTTSRPFATLGDDVAGDTFPARP